MSLNISEMKFEKPKSTLSNGCVSGFKIDDWGGYTLSWYPSQLESFARKGGEPEYHNTDDPRTFGYTTSAMSYYEFAYDEWKEEQEWVASQKHYFSDDDDNQDEL